MEIRTCEQYVLNELEKAQDYCEELKTKNDAMTEDFKFLREKFDALEQFLYRNIKRTSLENGFTMEYIWDSDEDSDDFAIANKYCHREKKDVE